MSGESDEASKDSDLRSLLIAVVSHDLRNPLNAITLNANLIKQYLPKDKSGDIVSVRVDNILRLTNVMERLISVMLDVEAIHQGKLVLVKRRQAVVDLLRETVETFLPLAGARDIRIEADFPDESIVAEFDFDRMQQVLSNLMGNAIKYTPKEGIITISAKISDEVEDQIVLCVTNTGPQIQKEEREKVFDKFLQLQRNDRSGLGLGLFICKWIVEAHDGTIWIADTELTTFCVRIPIA